MKYETIKIDFNVNDTWQSIVAFLRRLKKFELAISASEAHIIELDLSCCHYLGPDAAVLIARMILISEQIPKVQLKIVIPQNPTGLRDFWEKVGLGSLWETRKIQLLSSDAGLAIVPLLRYTDAKWQDADPVIRQIHKYQKLPEETEEYLRICINEVIQNVKDHASSEIGAVMTARFMMCKQEVRVAIIDSGLGICSTLKKRYPDTNPALALDRVTRGEYSAMSRPNNMGLGISNLCQIVCNELGGDVFIVSDAAIAFRRQKNPWNTQTLDFKFEGTGIFFTLQVPGVKS